jgi:hypothetical protein
MKITDTIELRQNWKERQTMKKGLVIGLLAGMLVATPAHAATVQDFGSAGSVRIEQESDGNDSGDEWIVITPGESGRGVQILNETGKASVVVDRYGGVYVNGKFVVNGQEYREHDDTRAIFTPINGMLYAAVLFSILMSFMRFRRKD